MTCTKGVSGVFTQASYATELLQQQQTIWAQRQAGPTVPEQQRGENEALALTNTSAESKRAHHARQLCACDSEAAARRKDALVGLMAQSGNRMDTSGS
jgi:hypothetical protein